MCGIAGLVRQRPAAVDASEVRQMCQAIIHRGPDDEGIYTRGSVGLGMRRLSIIDVAGGHQPIHNEDQTIWVVFNGEIYNFPELRAELQQKGHRFYTNSDTEVIVHLYEDLGAECIKKLRGMFGIALYDERKQYLLLARDRVGKKPLHYALDKGCIYFGSEIKAILAVAPHLAEKDPEGLLQFFYYDYIPDPYTAFRRIKKLPPGYTLEYVNGQVKVQQYWDLPQYGTQDPGSEEQCLDELDQRLAEAVRIRLISEVPLGALLSGGVDSSIVVALMARANSRPVKTFSIGFEDQDFNELQYARLVAQRFGTDHHELVVKPNISETLERLTHMMEEPFGDSSMIPTYYVSSMARRHVTVALAGDGGDELFAGYDRYVTNLKRRHFDSIPSWLGKSYRHFVYPHLPPRFRGRKLSWNISLSSRDRYLDGISFLPACHRERGLFSEEFLGVASGLPDPFTAFRNYYDNAPSPDPLSCLLYLDTKTYMTADVLAKVDRMSMATSLEVRAPILDHVFIEWVTSLPARWKYRDGTRKYILKKLAERLGIPGQLLHRRKQGFALPLVHWMRQEMKGDLLRILEEPKTLQRGYFNPRTVLALLDDHWRGRRDRSGVLWQLLVFELWHRNFLENKGLPVLDRGLDVTAAESKAPVPAAPTADVAVSYSETASPRRGRPIRVAIVAPSLRRIGGQAVQASLMMKNWQNDPDVKAEFVAIDPQFPRALSALERIPMLRTMVRLPLYLSQLWGAVGRADVVHIFSASYWSFLLAPTPAWIVSRMRGRKTLLNYRSGEARGHLKGSAVARSVLRKMDARVVPSSYLKTIFGEFAIDAEVVPNVVDLRQVRHRVRNPLRPILVCTRGCEPYYAIDDVVRAFRHVQTTFPDARLLLVGGGSKEPEIREFVARLGLANVEFWGRVSRERIGECYDQADILINASWLDNMPVSILEGFAAGMPVVSTAPEGIRYLVEHGQTGLLSEPHDWRALGENVIALLRDPALCQTLVRNAYRQSQLYRWNNVRERWLERYRALISGQTVCESREAAVAADSFTAEAK